MSVDDSVINDYPAPGADEIAHSRALVDLIGTEIEQAGGRLRFDRFMDHCLYAPGLGYYSAGAQKFGAAGDFVTAPEISVLFGRALAGFCAPVLETLDDGVIAEIGAGSGALACDLLSKLDALGHLPERYLIIETSADLKARQRDHIEKECAQHAELVEWLDEPPKTLRGVVIANEVVDALPVVRFKIGEHGEALIEHVLEREGRFSSEDVPAEPAMQEQIAALFDNERPPAGYRSEFCPMAPAWLAAMVKPLEKGAILIADYGMAHQDYYAPARTNGTLICHYRHRAHDDPLAYPGLQDISAWVDFTRLAEAGIDLGLELAGYTTQAHFLIGCGLPRLLAEAQAELPPEHYARLASEARRLLMPGEMGEHFKVMALSREIVRPDAAFRVRDLSTRL